MRTTVDIEDDVLLAAKAVAQAKGVSLGKAVSTLLREAFARPVNFERPDGFPVMPALPAGSVAPLGGELVTELLVEEDEHLSRFLLKQV